MDKVSVVRGNLGVTVIRALREAGMLVKLPRSEIPIIYDANSTIFLSYPAKELVKNTDRFGNYQNVRRLFLANKRDQSSILSDWFKTTTDEGYGPYVVRPLRHYGGQGFMVIEEKSEEYPETDYYYKTLFTREAEYRVVYAFGNVVGLLLKKMPDGNYDQRKAWNHSQGSTFVSITIDGSKLSRSSFFDSAKRFFSEYGVPDICAFDILYRKGTHRVCEINFAPGITIPSTIQNLLEAVRKV